MKLTRAACFWVSRFRILPWLSRPVWAAGGLLTCRGGGAAVDEAIAALAASSSHASLASVRAVASVPPAASPLSLVASLAGAGAPEVLAARAYEMLREELFARAHLETVRRRPSSVPCVLDV
jgi:hypothetical protein